MKKITLMAAVLALMLSACGGSQPGICNMVNPFVTHDSLTEAEEAAGFQIRLPDRMPDWISETGFQTGDNLLEVICRGDDRELRFRKAIGSQDISGVYEVFSLVEETSFGDRLVTLKGDSQGIQVAIWKDSKYTYSVTCRPGMAREPFESMLMSVIPS